MLTVHQPKLFSRNLVLYDGDSAVAEIRYRTFSMGADIRIGSTAYDALRTGWVRSTYLLEREGQVVARAEPVGWWGRAFELRAGASPFTFRRQRNWFAIGWELLDGDSVTGSVNRTGFFRARTIADLPETMDLAVHVFIVWMANVIWQQDQSAAAVVTG